MKRWALAWLAFLIAVPAAAQERPGWAGVWQGRIGTYPVRMCVDVWGDGLARGSYYYMSRLEPIALAEEDGEITWIEGAGTDAEAFWQPSETTATRLRGIWMQGGPCSAPEFLAPRVKPAEFTTERGSLEGWQYTTRGYRPPAHFGEDVTIASFWFTPEQPGDAAINAVLAGSLPRGTVDDEFVDCLAGNISSFGTDGNFEKTAQPVLASTAFLVVDEANSAFCGGAHPSYWQAMRVFDRRSGEEIDLFDWLGSPRAEDEVPAIADALRELVMARWPADAADCAEFVADTEFWSLGLARDGLVFQPDLPHAATPCEERVTVEWPALAPFLDAEGKDGLARLRGG